MPNKDEPKGETSIQLIYSRLTHIEDWLQWYISDYIDYCVHHNDKLGHIDFERYEPNFITEDIIDSFNKRINNLETETKNLQAQLKDLKDTINFLEQEVYISE